MLLTLIANKSFYQNVLSIWEQKFYTQTVNKYFSYSCYQIFNDILLTKVLTKIRGKYCPKKMLTKVVDELVNKI